MRLLVTGRTGQLAQCLVERAARRAGVEVVSIGRPEFDLRDGATIARSVAGANADLVISAAAYTAVDKAETAADEAMAANTIGPGLLAEAAASAGLPIIHVSTDYVFDGESDRPYVETDPTGPVSVYGASKLGGETAVKAANRRHLIVRTAWFYSPFGRNFVSAVLELTRDRDELRMVSDQRGSPSNALDVADGILRAADRMLAAADGFEYGVYHLAGSGGTTRSAWARHIMEASRAAGGPFAMIVDIPSSDYPTPAKRPRNSELSNAKFERTFGWTPPHWTTATTAVVERLLKGSGAAPD